MARKKAAKNLPEASLSQVDKSNYMQYIVDEGPFVPDAIEQEGDFNILRHRKDGEVVAYRKWKFSEGQAEQSFFVLREVEGE